MRMLMDELSTSRKCEMLMRTRDHRLKPWRPTSLHSIASLKAAVVVKVSQIIVRHGLKCP